MQPIKISLKIAGGINSIIPKGIIEELTIEVIDGAASYHFKDNKITRLFTARQKNDGVESVYSERMQKTICKYPNMSQKEIAEHIKQRLKDLGVKEGQI